MSSSLASKHQRLPGILAAVGFLLAMVTAGLHVQAYLAPRASGVCGGAGFWSCGEMSTSDWSVVAQVPLGLWGMVGFAALFAAAILRSRWLLPLSLAAALGGLGLTGLQLAKFGALCPLCTSIHLTSLALAWASLREHGSLSRPLKDPLALQLVLGVPMASFLALWLFLPRYWAAFSYLTEPPFPTGVTSEGHPWIGASEPKTILEEFTDYNCPHCRNASTATLRWLGRHPEARLVRRHQPRRSCAREGTCNELILALCAQDQGKFWQADRYLFETQAERRKLTPEAFAAALRLDRAALQSCITRPGVRERAQSLRMQAQKLRITETPTYLLDGKKLKTGELQRLF